VGNGDILVLFVSNPRNVLWDALVAGTPRHIPTRPLPSGGTLYGCIIVHFRQGGAVLPLSPLYAGPYVVLGVR
jgi:hypothetical protein